MTQINQISGDFASPHHAGSPNRSGALKRVAAAEALRCAIARCSLGAILVASSEKGVVAILIDDDAETLVDDLRDRFPLARLVEGGGRQQAMARQVATFVEAPTLGLGLPLDVRGTAFQQRVWQALREIPAGRIASYADIASAIGAPKAVRAVAGACANNKLAVAIPCHRVVKSDGSLSGYAWGVERKRMLLDREGVVQ
jgi:AraC family transcriptional regulator, regulatory protein of adaptative response / methylated-DNA-[protein]-cysteine methyltransferase